jgi:hypothetical protein
MYDVSDLNKNGGVKKPMQYGALDPRLVSSFYIDVRSCLANICYLGNIK